MSQISELVNNSYLIVTIDEVKYALHAKNVLSILELSPITKVPHSPEYMRGIVNLRGAILPVIDTRLKLGLTETVFTTSTCVIVTNFQLSSEDIHIGILVDFVNMVEEIFEQNISPPPSIGNKYRSSFISGVTRVGNEFIMLLDIVSLFDSSELISLQEVKSLVEQ